MFALQLDHVAFTVRAPEATAGWYERVLGLKRAHDMPGERYPIVLRAGMTAIALFPTEQPPDSPSATTAAALRHVAFRTDRENFLAVVRALSDRGIPFEREDHQKCRSVYLHDPDGHEIEITTYEIE